MSSQALDSVKPPYGQFILPPPSQTKYGLGEDKEASSPLDGHWVPGPDTKLDTTNGGESDWVLCPGKDDLPYATYDASSRKAKSSHKDNDFRLQAETGLAVVQLVIEVTFAILTAIAT